MRIATPILLLLLCLQAGLQAQPIIEAEYYFDNNDPGFGNATPLTGLTPGTVTEINNTISTASLSAGWHYLNIRTKSDSAWGGTERKMFYINDMSSQVKRGGRIERAEYFFGSLDPGMGQGLEFALPDTLQDLEIRNMVPTTNLNPGVNFISVRLRREYGGWSATSTHFFYLADTTNKEKIKALSYEIRQAGNTLTTGSFLLSPSQYVVNVTFDAATGALGAGMYEFCLKALDESNTSSQRSCRTFQVAGSGGGGVSIQDNIENGIRVYPNPTEGPITIESESLPILSYQLSDAQGRNLIHEITSTPIHKVSLDLQEYPAGIYFLGIEMKGELRVVPVKVLDQ